MAEVVVGVQPYVADHRNLRQQAAVAVVDLHLLGIQAEQVVVPLGWMAKVLHEAPEVRKLQADQPVLGQEMVLSLALHSTVVTLVALMAQVVAAAVATSVVAAVAATAIMVPVVAVAAVTSEG